jgi:hypothetical protein
MTPQQEADVHMQAETDGQTKRPTLGWEPGQQTFQRPATTRRDSWCDLEHSKYEIFVIWWARATLPLSHLFLRLISLPIFGPAGPSHDPF